MARPIISIIFVGVGIYVLSIWEAGSHGHLRFRSWMLEDWILSAIVLVCFGLPLYFLSKRFFKKGKTS